MSLVEMEGEPIGTLDVGVAGEFVFEGQRASREYEKSTGTWTIYDGTGKLAGIQGEGTFKITLAERRNEFILDFEGEYEL